MNKVPAGLSNYRVYNSLEDVSGAKPGDIVFLSGDEDDPPGLWRRDADNNWRHGAHTPQTQTDADQVTVSAGGSQVLSQFTLPTEITDPQGDTISVECNVNVWQAHVGRLSGSPSGLIIEIADTDGDGVFYDREASTSTKIDVGFPLASGGVEGNQIRIRMRNTSGQQKNAVGFIIWSLEFTQV